MNNMYLEIQERIRKVNLRTEIPFDVKKIEEKLKEFDKIIGRAFLPIKIWKNYKEFFSTSVFAPPFASTSAYAYISAYAYTSAFTYAIDNYFPEFLLSIKENENKKYDKFIQLQMLLLGAKENGLGFVFRDKEHTNIIKCPIFRFDENQKRHSLEFPAVDLYSDEDEYYIHGVKFDKKLWEVVKNKTISPQNIMKIENTDQRAMALRIVGAEKIFQKLKAKVIDKQTYLYGTDYLLELEGFVDGLKQPYKFIKGFNSETNDYVYVRTHPKCNTVEEAQSFCYRTELVDQKYNPQIRT